MPKELPTERFKIACEVEAAHLGTTVAQLTKLGLTNIHFELIEDIRSFAKKALYDVSSEDLLLEWIKDHPTFKAREACKYLETHGRHNTGAYPALGRLVKKKHLKKLDLGNYARTDVKHIEGPKKKPSAPRSQQINHREFVLLIGRQGHGRFSAAKVRERFIKDGRNHNSVATAIADLVKKKLVKRVSGGEYLLSNGPEQSKVNGAAEATHG
jgi:hypothetical protein